jgi:hypothetical protein
MANGRAVKKAMREVGMQAKWPLCGRGVPGPPALRRERRYTRPAGVLGGPEATAEAAERSHFAAHSCYVIPYLHAFSLHFTKRRKILF